MPRTDDDWRVARGQLEPLDTLCALIEGAEGPVRAEVVCTVQSPRGVLPIHAITMGNPDPRVSAIGVSCSCTTSTA